MQTVAEPLKRIVLFSHSAAYTTARYFERCLRARDGIELDYRSTLSDVAELPYIPDLFLYIDPAPGQWPLGIETLSCPTACYLIDVHQHLDSRLLAARFFDFVFMAQKDYVPRFSQAGLNACWLPLGCDPDVHYVPGLTREFEIGFVGSLGTPGTQRHEILSTVLPHFRTNDWRRRYSPVEMGRVYSQAKIVFNASINGDVNMRIFEALAAGALLITDRIENGLSDLLQEDTHYLGYSSIPEALEKIKYYLADDPARQQIARQGQQLALQAHTYAARCQTLLQHIGRNGPSVQRAPLRSSSIADVVKAYCGMCESLRYPAGIQKLMRCHGPRPDLLAAWARALARNLNARVPLTPNAMRNRLRRL